MVPTFVNSPFLVVYQNKSLAIVGSSACLICLRNVIHSFHKILAFRKSVLPVQYVFCVDLRTNSDCVVQHYLSGFCNVDGMEFSSRQCAAILTSAGCLAPTHFSKFHKRDDFRKKVTEHKMCVLIFSTTFI
jgi:hypothetical protein